VSSSRRALGTRGEAAARAFLEQRGYAIVTTNWRCAAGELDIVARDQSMLVFVEVRSRHANTTEWAWRSISPVKAARLEQLAWQFCADHDLHDDWRIDVIAIAELPGGRLQIEHAANALDW
jgi:putative endonuclease